MLPKPRTKREPETELRGFVYKRKEEGEKTSTWSYKRMNLEI